MAWQVVCEPEGKNPGTIKKAAAEAGVPGATPAPENVGGIVIYVADGTGRKEEISRVAWVRRASKNPKTSFEKQLAKELDAAREAVGFLNGLAANAGELQ